MALTLDALLTELQGLGQLNPNNWYRLHGTQGLEDLYKTGQIRAKPDGKYDSTYYSQGGPESRYMKNGKGALIEAMPSNNIEKIPDTRRYGITNGSNNLTMSDRIKIHQLMPDGAYKTVYDNITPWKFGLRTAGNTAMQLAAPAAVGSAIDSVLTNFVRPQNDRQFTQDFVNGLIGNRRESELDTMSYDDINNQSLQSIFRR